MATNERNDMEETRETYSVAQIREALVFALIDEIDEANRGGRQMNKKSNIAEFRERISVLDVAPDPSPEYARYDEGWNDAIRHVLRLIDLYYK
jgi:hypothetical protein